MSTRTITNTDYISAITVPGDVTVDTVDAKTGTFSDSVTAPSGTFTDIRANTASFDEIKDHIRTVDSIIELDTGNTGNSRTSGVVAKYVSGAETKHAGLLRGTGGAFHLVDDTTLPDADTDPATLAKADLTVKELSTAGAIMPSTNGAYDIGSGSFRYRSLYLGRTTGNVHLGINTIVPNAAQMFLHSSGDGYSQIHFGRDTISTANTKWLLSSRTSGLGNAFELFRGPYLTGDGAHQMIWSVHGSNGHLSYVLDTDATNSTTAPVTYAGGVGIAKSLHVGTSINAGSLTTTGAITSGGHILPSTAGTTDLGSSTRGFRKLLLQEGAGRIGLGWSIRVTSQAELHLNSSSDARSEITFGNGNIARANCKWGFNSFGGAEGNHFSLMRGPALTDDSNWQYIYHVDGSTAQFRYNIDTDSVSTTTGAVTFAGGVGIAKSLHVGNSITTGDLKVTGTLDIGSVTLDDLKLSSSILALDTENADDLRTSGIVSKYVTGGATRYAGLLRKAGGGFHLVDAPSLPDPTTDSSTLPRSSLSVQLMNVNGGTFRLDGSRNNVLAGSRIGSSMYNTWSSPPQRLIAIGSDILDNTWSPNEWSVVAIGHDIMNTVGVDEKRVAGSIAIGTRALKSYVGNETLPFPCIAIGRDAMSDSTEAYGCVAIGTGALRNGTTSWYAVAIGQDAAKTGNHNYGVSIGYRAGESAGGNYNTGVGYLALQQATGSNNTSVGANSLQRATGHSNVGIGQGAGVCLTTGSDNTFVGSGTGVPNGSPFVAHCTAIGSGITTTHSNTAVIGSGDVSNVLFGHSNTATAGAGSATLGTVANPVKGIYLASPDGTPALLNRYESFNVITTISGPWTGEKPFIMRITVIGPQVFISAQRGLYPTTQSASLIATAGGSIPERLRPGIDDDVVHVITGISNAGVETLGKVSVTPAGILTISPDPVGNGGWNHIEGGAARWGRLNFSYTLA